MIDWKNMLSRHVHVISPSKHFIQIILIQIKCLEKKKKRETAGAILLKLAFKIWIQVSFLYLPRLNTCLAKSLSTKSVLRSEQFSNIFTLISVRDTSDYEPEPTMNE